jgi:hypothetical protein
MEIKQISGIFISHFNDTLMNLTYSKILTKDTLEAVRFPTLLENYKYRNLIQPNYIVTIELVKTRKNWIVRSVLSHKVIYQPDDFSQYLSLCEIIKTLSDNIREEQKTDALEFVVGYLSKVKKIDLKEFDNLLQKVLGFSDLWRFFGK